MTLKAVQSRFRATVPRIPVTSVTETLDFFVGKLGFKPLYRFGDEAGVGLGEIILRLCEEQPIENDDFVIYFEITNTDDLFEKYKAQGVEVTFPPRDQPWGSRDFGIWGPDRYRLVFGDFRDQSERPQPALDMRAAIEAMMAGDIARLQKLLDADPALIHRRAPMPYRADRQGTLLHFLMDFPAGEHPDNVVEIARLLIQNGADVESLDGEIEGSSPLQLLMGIETPTPFEAELTALLLDAGATTTNANPDQSGMDVFTVALLHGHTECAALMFERGFPPNFSWVGAGLGRMNIVHSFFGEGDDGELPKDQRADSIDDPAPNMNCAFLVAAINGQSEVVKYLLNRGIDINMQPPGSDFAGIGATALHWAARNGRLETVELLVDRGADLTVTDDVFQLTPAGWAGWYGHSEIRHFLLDSQQATGERAN